MTRVRMIRHRVWAKFKGVNAADTGPLRVDLVYRTSDPFAVELRFHTGSQWVHWYIARDLLTDGALCGDGEGDVQITPDAHDWSRVWLRMSSPTGVAAFEFARVDLDQFTDAVETLVPRGTEGELIDWDREISSWLGEVA